MAQRLQYKSTYPLLFFIYHGVALANSATRQLLQRPFLASVAATLMLSTAHPNIAISEQLTKRVGDKVSQNNGAGYPIMANNTATATRSTQDLGNGKKLYKRLCTGCHGADGRGGAHTFMPHVAKLTEKGYIDLVPDEYLQLVIAKGGSAVGKSSYMPAWESTLSQNDIADIIAHIRNLPSY